MTDPFDLDRFVVAQGSGVYEQAVAELSAGRKGGHWMWFVFPQIAGLGPSAMSRRFALSSLDEARAYLAHSLLGPRLVHCARVVATHDDLSAQQMFGSVDAVKLRSSMTLFLRAAVESADLAAVFAQVLDRHFDGVADPETDRRL